MKSLVFASSDEAFKYLADLTKKKVVVAYTATDELVKPMKEVLHELTLRAIQQDLTRRPNEIEKYINDPKKILEVARLESRPLESRVHKVIADAVSTLDTGAIVEELDRWGFHQATEKEPRYSVL